MRIKNKSWSPLVISLPGGDPLTLSGRSIGEVSAEDLESPELRRLLRSRTIIVLPEEGAKPAGAEPQADNQVGQPEDEPEEDGPQ